MKHHKPILWVGTVTTALVMMIVMLAPTVHAEDTVIPDLAIRQLKLGDHDAVALQAQTAISDLQHYWLGYDSDVTKAAIPEQQLPTGSLAPGESIILAKDSADGLDMCGLKIPAVLKMTFANETGQVTLWQKDASTMTNIDTVRWMKPTASKPLSSGIDIATASLSATLKYATWYRIIPGDSVAGAGVSAGAATTTKTGWYRADNKGVCDVEISPQLAVAENDTQASDNNQMAPDQEAVSDVNAGLQPVFITELLPNPDHESAADAEYIELYNPNDSPYDISGFVLRSGLQSTYNYTIPANTRIEPKSYVVLYAEDTRLVLSNASGKAVLTDLQHKVVSETQAYQIAPSGWSWAYSMDTKEWKWTNQPTPAEANTFTADLPGGIVKGVSTKKTSLAAGVVAASKVKTTSVKTASTQKPAATKTVKPKTTKAAAKKKQASAKTNKQKTDKLATVADKRPVAIHPGVLAVVGVTAVGYGLYEYRRDIANRIYQFRTNRAARRTHRG